MGITGLIPFLEKASTPVNITNLKGNTVCIDSYCFLHKGAFSCAEKLARGEKVFTHILYCLKYVNMLLENDIKPILVFDGRHLPAKALTEQKRRESREEARKRAAALLRRGKTQEARSYLKRCVDITHEMAIQLMQECRKLNVDCITAPYEADSQLAFFSINDIAQYVITEDSDLVLFGCKKIIFKLDLSGNGLLIESDKLHLAMGCNIEKFQFKKFRYMCILSGCDYLDSLPGIGLAKSCKFITKTDETDIKIFLRKIPAYLNMRHLEVTDDYINNFLKADATFQHMLIYNPIKRKLMPLFDTNLTGITDDLLCNAGEMLDDNIAYQLALGNLDPFTLKQLDNWNPDILPRIDLKSKKQIMKHKSIWQPEFTIHKPEKLIIKEEQKIKTSFSYKNVVEEEIVERISDSQLLQSYIGNNEPQRKRQCRKDYKIEEEIISPNQIKRNPFLKTNPLDLLKSPLKNSPEKLSLLNQISPIKKTLSHISLKKFSKFDRTFLKSDEKIISKFFNTSTVGLKDDGVEDKKNPLKLEDAIVEEDETLIKTDINNEIKNEKSIEFFETINNKIEENLVLSGGSSKENNVLLESFEIESSNDSIPSNLAPSIPTLKTKSFERKVNNAKSRKSCRQPGLSKKNTTSSGSIQTRLSQFGFQKRPQLN